MVSHDEAPPDTASTAVSEINTAGEVAPDPCPYVTAASLIAFTASATNLLAGLGTDSPGAPIDGTPNATVIFELALAALRECVHGALFGPLTAYGSAEHAAALNEALGHLQSVMNRVRRLAASASRAQRIVDLADIEPTALAALDAASECVFAPDGYQYETFSHFFELLHSAAQLFLLLDGDTQACQSAGDLAQLTEEAAQSLPAVVRACKTFHARAESYLHKAYQTAFDHRMRMVGQDYSGNLEHLTVVDRALARSLSETVPRTNATEAATFALAKATGYRIAQAYADTLLVREAALLLNAVFNRPAGQIGEYCRPALLYTNIATILAFHHTVEPDGVAAGTGQNLGFVKALAKPEAITLLADELGHVPVQDDALVDLVTEHGRARSQARELTQDLIAGFASSVAHEAITTYLLDSRQVEKLVNGKLVKILLNKASPLKSVFVKGLAGLLGPLASAGIGLLFNAMFPKDELTAERIKEMIGEALSDAFAKHNVNELILDIQAYDRAARKSAAHVEKVKPQNANAAIVLPAYEKACDVFDRAFKNMSSDPSNIKTHIDSRIYTLSMWLEAVSCMLKEAAICMQADSLTTIRSVIFEEVQRRIGKCTKSFDETLKWIHDKIWINRTWGQQRTGYFPEVFWAASGDTVYDRKMDWDHVIAERLKDNFSKVEDYSAAFTAGHVMNYLQLRNIQDNLDRMVATWNKTFKMSLADTGQRATFWFNKFSSDLGWYGVQTLTDLGLGSSKAQVQHSVNGGRYKLGDYPREEADWSCYLEDVHGQKLYLPPGSYADLSVLKHRPAPGQGLRPFGTVSRMAVGLGLHLFLWTETQFGIYFDETKPMEFFDDDGHWVKRPVEQRRGTQFSLPYPPYNSTRVFLNANGRPIRSAVIAYDFKNWYLNNMTWTPAIRLVGTTAERNSTAEPPDLVDFKIG